MPFQKGPHQKVFYPLKVTKNYKKEKMKGGLSWMTNIGNELARFLMGTIFLVHTVYVGWESLYMTSLMLVGHSLGTV